MPDEDTRKRVFKEANDLYKRIQAGDLDALAEVAARPKINDDGHLATLAHRHGGIAFAGKSQKKRRLASHVADPTTIQQRLAEIEVEHKVLILIYWGPL